jgi:hypothetical protein
VGKGSERDSRAEALQNSVDAAAAKGAPSLIPISGDYDFGSSVFNIENANAVVVDGSEAVRESERREEGEGEERSRERFLVSLPSYSATTQRHMCMHARTHTCGASFSPFV